MSEQDDLLVRKGLFPNLKNRWVVSFSFEDQGLNKGIELSMVSGELKMQKLIELIARSRKVELDIISTQFGPLIDPEKLRQMNRDLLDLEATLNQSDNPRR